jgi:4-hydroxybenzoate-CoA ligase
VRRSAAPEDAARWSYGEIEDVVLRMAHGLAARGLAPGERLFIRMGNSIDYALMVFAANAAGLVPIPASPMLSVHEARTIIDDCRPAALVTDGTLALPDLPDETAVLGPDDIARLKRGPRGDYAATRATTRPSSSIPRAPRASRRACCMASGRCGGGGRCIAAGMASSPTT